MGRKLRGTQVANVGAYPFTQTAHPKYAEFLHNAIGNLFEIRDFANTAANLILRDIYWEKSEFEHTVEIAGLSVQVPNIMLCFNNYGATYDIPGDGPRASAGAEMLAFKVNFFKSWLDEANERLDGLSPRQAVADAVKKKELLKLLAELEKAEAKLPKKERYSFKGVRKELGLG